MKKVLATIAFMFLIITVVFAQTAPHYRQLAGRDYDILNLPESSTDDSPLISAKIIQAKALGFSTLYIPPTGRTISIKTPLVIPEKFTLKSSEALTIATEGSGSISIGYASKVLLDNAHLVSYTATNSVFVFTSSRGELRIRDIISSASGTTAIQMNTSTYYNRITCNSIQNFDRAVNIQTTSTLGSNSNNFAIDWIYRCGIAFEFGEMAAHNRIDAYLEQCAIGLKVHSFRSRGNVIRARFDAITKWVDYEHITDGGGVILDGFENVINVAELGLPAYTSVFCGDGIFFSGATRLRAGSSLTLGNATCSVVIGTSSIQLDGLKDLTRTGAASVRSSLLDYYIASGKSVLLSTIAGVSGRARISLTSTLNYPGSAEIWVAASHTVTIISQTDENIFATSDTPGKFCIFDSAGDIVFKNNLDNSAYMNIECVGKP